jgi:hypothetical protein
MEENNEKIYYKQCTPLGFTSIYLNYFYKQGAPMGQFCMDDLFVEKWLLLIPELRRSDLFKIPG